MPAMRLNASPLLCLMKLPSFFFKFTLAKQNEQRAGK